MEDDKEARPSHEEIKQIADRLKYLETVARDTASRLHAIETRLDIAYRGAPGRASQPPQPERPVKPAGPSRPAQPPSQPTARKDSTEPSARRPLSQPAFPIENHAETRQPITAIPPLPPKPAPVMPPPTAVSGEAVVAQAPPSAVHPITPATPAEQMRQTHSYRPREASQKRLDLESRIGGRWLLWIGVIAISFGVAFFLKFAFDNEWITPGWRINIGVAIGLGFLIGAERLRDRYPVYSHGLTGGGIFILYLSIFVGFNTYALIPRPLALILMAAVTATASLLAARYSALPIAILGLIGGFLTPILLSTGVDNEAGLFGYIAVLDLGVLALAYSKQWRSLNYMAFGATVAMFAAWMIRSYAPEKLWATIFFLTVFFMIFALLAVLHNVVNRRPTLWIDLAMVFSNALLYFSTSYELLDDNHHGILGLFAVLVSAFYMGLGYLAHRRDREDTLLTYTFLGLGFLFAVLAIPIQLDQHWVTMGWALEGVAMTWIGLRVNDRTSRYVALIVFGVAVAHWFRVDVHDFAYQTGQNFVPLLNHRALSCAVLVAALAAGARLYHRYRDAADETERSMFSSLYVLGANAAAILLLSLDANDYFARSREIGGLSAGPLDIWNNSRQFTLSALWTLYGTVTLAIGITRNQKVLRAIAGLLLGVATLKVLAVDLAYHDASWHITILNQTFVSLVLLVFGLAVSARLYARSNVPADETRVVVPALILAANVLALIALTTEPLGYFDRATSSARSASASPNDLAHLKDWMHFTLTAVWTVYVAVALAVGFRRNAKTVRLGALLLLGFTTVKLLAVDARYYVASWHSLLLNQTFVAFALVIAAVSFSIYLYSRSERVEIEERQMVTPILVAVANALALIALSLEPIGYFKRTINMARSLGAAPAEIAQFDNSMHFTLIAIWSAYAAVALVIAFRRNSKFVRLGALALLGFGTLKVLVVDAHYYHASWHGLLLNETFGAFLLVIAVMSLGAYLYSISEEVDENEREMFAPVLVAGANLLGVAALSLEAIGYYKQEISGARLSGAPAIDVWQLLSSMHFALTAIWTVFAATALVIGIKRGAKSIRWGALLLLTLSEVKLLAIDLRYYDAEWHRLVFNQTFAGFAILVAALACAIAFYARADKVAEPERTTAVKALMVVANLFAIIGLSAEAVGHYEQLIRASGLASDTLINLQLAQRLSLSVVWMVYGGAMLAIGFWRGNKLLRIMALSLLGLAILKVFFIDLSSLEKLYRIISFIVLGAILLGVSFLYQRFRQQMVEPENLEGQTGAEP